MAVCWLLKRHVRLYIRQMRSLSLKLPRQAIKYGYALIHRKVSMIQVGNKTVMVNIRVIMFSFITLSAESCELPWEANLLWYFKNPGSILLIQLFQNPGRYWEHGKGYYHSVPDPSMPSPDAPYQHEKVAKLPWMRRVGLNQILEADFTYENPYWADRIPVTWMLGTMTAAAIYSCV